MLFNSPFFIFIFLPVALVGFFILGRLNSIAARIWLILASLFFYAWWNPAYLLLLLGSAAVNYSIGKALQSERDQSVSRKALLWIGVGFNLLLLGYFKYFAFLMDTFAGLTGVKMGPFDIVLPLAISFFTFQKIAFLVDSHAGKIKSTTPLDYLLFISFFPQLIAGPIVHYDEVVPQFRNERTYRLDLTNLHDGIAIFLLGLAKKVVLADTLGGFVKEGFDAAAGGAHLSLLAAWAAVLAYTLQIYFDFSGYSDMAIGLGRMFNVRLPLNFDSPYKTNNIIDFWRRWHMTLSRFLRDYVYIPLGGNRAGSPRRYANVMLTMLIGGLWHGAGWTFLFWGALHGFYLLINHMWRAVMGPPRGSWLGGKASHLLTLLAVILAWVFFRAPDFHTALRLYQGMAGLNGAILPSQYFEIFPLLQSLFKGVGVVPFLGHSTVMGVFEVCTLLALGYLIVLCAPTIHQMPDRVRYAALVLCFAFALQQVLFASTTSPFLYFQF